MSEKVIFKEGIGEVKLVRKARSTRLRISVKASGEVLVSIPWQFTFSRGEEFLEEKREWVLRALKKMEKRGVTRKPPEPGFLFATLHKEYHLQPWDSVKFQIRLKQMEKEVILWYPAHLSLTEEAVQAKIRMLLEGALRYEAKRYLPVRARELATRLGYTFQALTIKNNRTNWGSCSSLKNINLNLHLMRLPERLIDFIIVHELVHTQIPNHGPSFKARLRSHFPDADPLEKMIRKYRPELF
ncbi:MAG: M48 family metallopeptidase [Marinilabiliales bacterium]|nr:M48 family metallopeptidase [Marinilabiliales bacterium]